jgi:hypothetical protein
VGGGEALPALARSDSGFESGFKQGLMASGALAGESGGGEEEGLGSVGGRALVEGGVRAGMRRQAMQRDAQVCATCGAWCLLVLGFWVQGSGLEFGVRCGRALETRGAWCLLWGVVVVKAGKCLKAYCMFAGW